MDIKVQETRRQHYIPRMLLKRFASRSKKSNRFILCIGKSGKHFESSINKVGVSTWFYGKEGDVENFLSDMESRASSALDDILLKNYNPNAHLDSLIPFLWLMHWRTLSIREAAADVGSNLFASLGQAMFGGENSEIMDSLIIQGIHEELKNIPPELRKTAETFFLSPAGRSKMLDALHSVAFPAMGETWSDVCDRESGRLKETIGKSLIEAVRKMIGTGKTHPDNFAPSRLRVQWDAPGSFILGDSCTFCVSANGEVFGVARATDKEWAEIYLPIAHNCVLVAERGNTGPLKKLSTQEINEQSSKLSTECLFASDKKHISLSGLIGQMSLLMEAEETKAISKKALQELWNERVQK